MSLSSSLIFMGSLLCFTAISFAEDTCMTGTKHYRMGARHIESGGIGYNQGYTTLETFLAPNPSQSSILPFIDLRGHIFNDGKFAANAGVGIRGLSDCRVYGANIYYDYRDTNHQHYNQIGMGLESLGIRWDFRANGYLPVGAKRSSLYDSNTTSVSEFDMFQVNQALIKQTLTKKGRIKYAMSGANTEAAFHILKNENIDLYAAAGPYYYNYSSKQAIGGQVRLGAQICEYLSVEAINSYDSRFHENIQGSIGINIPFGPKPKISKNKKLKTCSSPCLLAQRLVQDVKRQEIIVVDKLRQTTISEVISPAIDPLTSIPYFFVFVDNTSNSDGTYESPYHTLAQAQENSSPNDIIYVFPGDGTTAGMDSGIFLKANQKLWGSGINHTMQTSEGTISISAQSDTYPSITNTNFDTEGNAITLAANNEISGLRIISALNDSIYGSDPQDLEISSCIIEGSSTYVVEASFADNALISITNNQFLNNTNGVILTLNGTSNVICSNNTFEGQTSVSSIPFAIISNNNSVTASIENNIFNENETGSISLNLTDVTNANITVLDNIITNNNTGFFDVIASSFTILSTGVIDHCLITLNNNTFSENTSNSLYMYTSGEITSLEVTASGNTMSNNGGSALVLATQADYLTLLATNNTISNLANNGIAVISNTPSISGEITINNNTILDVLGESNGISISQGFSSLDLTIMNNEINRCEGSGIISYSSGIDSLTLNISNNTINNCQNLGSNAGSGVDIEQYTNLIGSFTNNTLLDNAGASVAIGSTLESPYPTTCLTFANNNSNTDYSLTNNVPAGIFNLSPCNVDSVNIGTITTYGTFTPVQSCPATDPCPP